RERSRRNNLFERPADGDPPNFADQTCARVSQQHSHSPQLGGVIVSGVSGAIMVRHMVAQEQIRRRDSFEISQFVNDFRIHDARIITPRALTRQYCFKGGFEMPKSMLGFSLGSIMLLFAACGKPEGSQAQTSPSSTAQTPTLIVRPVRSLELNRQIRLPGEVQAWQDTAIYAKVQGFVEEINVDRGSVVKRGQLLARLRAPELDTQRGEAEARVRAA